MGFQAATDLKTILVNNFIHTNVTGLTADPTIRLTSDSLPTSFPVNGEIVINNERMGNFDYKNKFRNEPNAITCLISFQGTVDVTREFLDEVDRVLNANNLATAGTRTYFMVIESAVFYEELAPIKQLQFEVRLTKEMVSI
jgi:hypothetical protein